MQTKKIILFTIILLAFAVPTHATSTVFSDNFNSGSLSGYDQNSGTWTAASFYLDGATFDGGAISHSVTMDLNKTYYINFRERPVGNGTVGEFFWFTDQNGIGNISGYDFSLQNGSTRLRRRTNGVITNLVIGPGATTGVFHDINIIHKFDGNITVYYDGVFFGQATDTTYNHGSRIVWAVENGATPNHNWDDVSILSTGAQTGDVNANMEVSLGGYGTDSNTGRKYVNILDANISYVCLAGRSGLIRRYVNNSNDENISLTCDGSTIPITDEYQSVVNGSNFLFKYSIQDLTFGNQFFTSDSNYFVDINAPTADLNNTAAGGGFTQSGGSVTVNLVCRDEVSPRIDFDITRLPDNTNYLHQRSDANTTQSVSIPVNSPSTNFLGTCTDLAGNSSTDLNTVNVQISCFNLVDEISGVQLAGADFNQFTALKATSYLTGATYDFRTPRDANVCFTGRDGDTIRFDINYSDGTQIFREFNQTILTHYDTNVNVCVADTQSFFEQAFDSSQHTPIVLKEAINGCFNTADYTKYANGDALTSHAFTVLAPYYMETFDANGNKIVLAQINGGTPSEIQVDVLKFKLGEVPIGLVNDFLGVSLYIPDGQTDSNTLKIYYVNYQEDNIQTDLTVTDNSSTLFSYTNTASPNVWVNYFDFTTTPVDGNVLTFTLVKTKADMSKTTEVKTFTLRGQEVGGAFVFPAPLAMLLVFVIFFFGITMVAARFALGWFGIFLSIICLGILAFASQAWYILWYEAVILIIAAYFGIIYKEETAKVT